MCEVATATLISAGISAITAAYGYQQQKKATAQMALVQQEEISAQAQQRTQDRFEEARQLRAKARAAAAEAGIGGASVDALLQDIGGQAGRDVALIEANRRSGVRASQAEAAARNRSARTEFYGQLADAATTAYSGYRTAKAAGKDLTIPSGVAGSKKRHG